jgi:hypothetical protein
MTPEGLLGLIATILVLGLVVYMLMKWNAEVPKDRKDDDRKI